MISREEWRWVVWFAAVILLVTSLPYLAGYAAQGSDWRFTGSVFGVEDGNSYIAKMLSGQAGSWLFRTPYTAHPQRGVMAFLPYLLLGKLAAPPGLHVQLAVLFHMFRLAAGLADILATYAFIAVFLEHAWQRRWALAVILLGGGLGWLLALLGLDGWLGSLPLDFYSPETFGFLQWFGLPHLALARAFLLWGLARYLSPSGRLGRSGMETGVLWLLLGLAQPLTVVIAWTVLAAQLGFWGLSLWMRTRSLLQGLAWEAWRTSFGRAAMAVLVSSPVVLYTLTSFASDPFLVTWTAQNQIRSPHPVHYLLAYGLILIPAVLGGRRLLQETCRPEESKAGCGKAWLPVAWALILPILAYLPFNLQRRLPEGGWVALVILAVYGLGALWRQSSYQSQGRASPLRSTGRILMVSPVFLSTLFLFTGALLTGLRPATPAFRPAAEIAAFEALAEQAPAGAVVLSSFEAGNALPAWAPVRVVIGHGPESAGLEALKPQVQAFYQSGTSDSQRAGLLESQGVDFVFWGPDERALGDWDPAQSPALEPVYAAGGYAVFRVQGAEVSGR